MGYSISIGEWEKPRKGSEDTVGSVTSVHLEEAPAFGEPTDYTNARWPSYSGWANFLKETGLEWLSPRTSHEFKGEDVRRGIPALMVEHPGVSPVLPVHLAAIEEALVTYRAKIGLDKQPGWPVDMKGAAVAGAEHLDGNLARLTWLRFWVKWALENCRNPVLLNT